MYFACTSNAGVCVWQVILAVVIAWAFTGILTATDTLTQQNVRTDSKQGVLDLASWFFFPYPGKCMHGHGSWDLSLLSLCLSVCLSVCLCL